MTYSEIVDLARHRKQKFGRSVSVEVYKADHDIVAITRLHDDYHDMGLAFLIDGRSLVLKGLDGRMDRIPYSVCEQGLSTLRSLVGTPLFQRGILKVFRARVPRDKACTHMTEMIESSLRALFAAMGAMMEGQIPEGLTREERRNLIMQNPLLKGTCVSFAEVSADPDALRRALEKTGGRLPGPATGPDFNGAA